MSHDLEASYAGTEAVNHFLRAPADCFGTPPPVARLSGCAAREGRHAWPHADGVIELVDTSGASPKAYNIALEFKRPNEGLHGVLTAIGQSHAYLSKGYAGAIIVIPGSYPGFSSPGPYVRDVLDQTSKSEAIGVFTYSRPDLAKISPFEGRLTLQRAFKIDAAPPLSAALAPSRTETQWAHVREGSTDPDAFFKYLQCVKLLGGTHVEAHAPFIPRALVAAAEHLNPGCDAAKYLANCPNDELPDRAWRSFWYKYILHKDAIRGWKRDDSGALTVNEAASFVQRSDGAGPKMFFVGRSDSIKNRLTRQLTAGDITKEEACELLAQNYHDRAHSYREDVDSGCEHLGFVDGEGRLTDSGYRFVDACERYGSPSEGLPRAIFLNALLNDGALGAFLHYVHRLSENRFGTNPLAFTASAIRSAAPTFQRDDYLQWLEQEMETNLKVIRKVSARGGTARRPFQAELAVLRSLGVVSKSFRIGVGMVINWPELQEGMTFNGAVFRT